jgi:L-lactate dehydrogenase complex protein LldF
VNLDPKAFPETARAALKDPLLRPALGRLKTHFGAGRAFAVQRYGDFESLRAAGKAIRDYAVTHLDDLLVTFEASVNARGGTVHWARDAAEARTLILDILKQAGA